ncbi:MAG: hypothetical protein PHO02_04165 [Candidatus Nanoarchaeia archaeon]|nr:hypothetical protein [Candidatus Nanoarchaeia archaeon]
MKDYDKMVSDAQKIAVYEERIDSLKQAVTAAKVGCVGSYIGVFGGALGAVYETANKQNKLAAIFAGLAALCIGTGVLNSCAKTKCEGKIAELEARKNSLEAKVKEE